VRAFLTTQPILLLLPLLLVSDATPALAQQVMVARLLGTGGPSLSLERAEAGLLVVAGSEVLLFDCGRGVPERLAQLPLSRIGVSKVFLTHLHSDHTEGLPVLWMNNGAWLTRGFTPLSVWGPGYDVDQPANVADLTTSLSLGYMTNTHIRRDLVDMLPGDGIQFNTTVISDEGVVYQNNGVTVTAFLVDHAPVKPAFGYRVDYQGHSVVYSGDTTASSNLVKYAQGTDVLVHEVFITPVGPPPGFFYHTTPEQAAAIFTQVAPKLAVYTHIVDPAGAGAGALIDRTRAAGYTGALEVGQDLTLIRIGPTVDVARCPSSNSPSITAITSTSGSAISTRDTVVISGSNFTIGDNHVYWRQLQGGLSTILLDENDRLYFSDQANDQIRAELDARITPGRYAVSVQTGCSLYSSEFFVTVN
jgi:ribonuclease Z